MSQDQMITTSGTIRNKDIAILSRVLYTMQDVCITERKRFWMQDRLYSITAKLTGMPGGHGGGGGLDKCFAEISVLEERYRSECAEYVDELKRAEEILNAIPSRTMRTFVTMKYVMSVGDADIRRELNMTRTGFNRAQRCVERAECMAAVKWRERYILENVKKL